MTILNAAFLGILQGLTEFLPVSSSGHLVLAQHLLGVGPSPAMIAFDVALHFASLLAIVVVFFGRIRDLLFTERRTLLFVVVATVPAGVVGLLFRARFEALSERPALVAGALMVTGIILFVADMQRAERLETKHLGILRSALVGLAQAIAIVPGISRSGSTITTGLVCGLKRPEAFSFSFLMAIPVIAGAAALELPKLAHMPEISPAAMAVGMSLSFVFSMAGLLALRRVLVSRKLKWLGLYCIAAGAFALYLLHLILRSCH